MADGARAVRTALAQALGHRDPATALIPARTSPTEGGSRATFPQTWSNIDCQKPIVSCGPLNRSRKTSCSFNASTTALHIARSVEPDGARAKSLHSVQDWQFPAYDWATSHYHSTMETVIG